MTRVTSTLCIFALFALYHGGAPPSAAAQTGTASVYGEVTDAQGQVVPGALVTVTNTQTGASQSVVTDSRGAFRVVALRPGRYRVTT